MDDPVTWDILKWVLAFLAACLVGGLGWFLSMLWNRQTDQSDDLIAAIERSGHTAASSIETNRKQMHEMEGTHVRQDHLEMQLDPIRKSIDQLRADNELRHKERAAEAAIIIKELTSRKG